MYAFASSSGRNRDEYRAELRRLTDLELFEAGRSLRSLCVNQAGGIPNPSFVLQLDEALAEWRERVAKRRAGVNMCLCHYRGRQPITPTAQMWRHTFAQHLDPQPWIANR